MGESVTVRPRVLGMPVAAAVLVAALAGCASSTRAVVGPSPAASAQPQMTTSASGTSVPPTSRPAARTSPQTQRSVPPTAARPSTSAAPTTAAPTPVTTGPRISGRTIVLNPGHNGGNAGAPAVIDQPVPSGFGKTRACDTTGTETNAGYSEHAFNWDVTRRVEALLEARGVTVILTRPDDVGVGPCIDERARIGNQAGVAAVVSIHADGAPTDGHGFHICEDSRQPNGPAVAAQSHALTVAVHDTLASGSGLTTSTYIGSNGYYPREDLAGLNLALVPATFIELGNMRNSGDAALQSSPAGRARIAAAISAGILNWLA